MKARIFWVVVALALFGGVGYQVVRVSKTRSVTEEKKSEVLLIKTARLGKADLSDKLAFTGTVRPRNEVDVFSKSPGRIESLNVQIGDKVKAGQVLAVVEHKEVSWQAQAAQASVKVAKANLDGAKLELDRTENLFKGGAAPKAQLDGIKVRYDLAQAQLAQAEAAAGLAEQAVANATVVAPISGTIIRRPVNVGMQIGPAAPICAIQDIGTLKLETSVDAAAFARLAKEAPAAIYVDALPGESFPGKVTLMSPALDPISRRASIEIEVDNASGRLLPNSFARAEVVVGNLKSALAVPTAAIFAAPGGAVVYRVKAGQAELVRPKLGAIDADKAAVIGGLAEGDEVAISGLPTLSDGVAVKVAPSAAN